MPKTLDFSVGAGHARETHRPIVLCASRAACPRRSGGPITLPPGGHGTPDDHHGRSGFGKCSHVFRKTGKKSGMVIFSSMIPVGCAFFRGPVSGPGTSVGRRALALTFRKNGRYSQTVTSPARPGFRISGKRKTGIKDDSGVGRVVWWSVWGCGGGGLLT